MNKLLAILVAFCAVQGLSAKIINCYWESWAYYNSGDGKFTVDNIDPNLCTHVSYAFFGLGSDNKVKSLDTYLDYDLGTISKAVALKKKNPKLKIMASVGGWSEGSTKYSNMASDNNKRKTFINSVVDLLKTHGFDGMDLDWEYPGQRGGSSNDRANFVLLLGELETAFAPHGYQLSIAVGADEGLGKTSYDIAKIAKEVTFINLMTYDFVSGYESKTGFNAPLSGVESAVNYWLSQGAPASKLVMGIGFYGHSFTLKDSSNHGAGAAASGPGKAGPFTQEAGYLGYNEICVKGWTTVFDSSAGDPYSYSGNQWVGYDNARSIDLKMDFALKKNLGGAMMWAIDNDDFRGKCGSKYPLLNAMNKKLK